MSTETVLQSYVVAYVFWLCMSLGCFGLMLLHHVLRGRWGLVILRLLEAGSKTLPLMAIGMVPILLAYRTLYPWASPDIAAHDHVLHAKLWYLNAPFWIGRTVAFFAFWIGMTALLTRWTKAEDRTGDPDYGQKRSNVSAPGLVLYVLSVTFAFTDLVMALEAHWFSTIWGVLFVVQQGLAAMSLVVLIVLVGSRRPPFAGLVTPALTRDLGNMLLTLTMLWGYLSISQYLIIWQTNLPEEVQHFVVRQHEGWNWVATFVVIGQFFVPFLLLLSTALKRSARMLGTVAAGILLVRAVDVIWTVAPGFQNQAAHSVALDAAMIVTVGLAWWAWFAAARRTAAPLPSYDPRLVEAVSHA